MFSAEQLVLEWYLPGRACLQGMPAMWEWIKKSLLPLWVQVRHWGSAPSTLSLHLQIHNICSSFWQQNNQSKRNQAISRAVILLMVTVVCCQVSLWKCGILHALQCALPFSKAQICFLTFYYAIPDKNSNLSPLTWLRTAYMYMDIFVQDNNVMFHFPLPTN